MSAEGDRLFRSASTLGFVRVDLSLIGASNFMRGLYPVVLTPRANIHARIGLRLVTHSFGLPYPNEQRWFRARRAFAALCGGNRQFSIGDRATGDGDFHRCFQSEDELIREVQDAGLEVVEMGMPEDGCRKAHAFAHAVLRIPPAGAP